MTSLRLGAGAVGLLAARCGLVAPPTWTAPHGPADAHELRREGLVDAAGAPTPAGRDLLAPWAGSRVAVDVRLALVEPGTGATREALVVLADSGLLTVVRDDGAAGVGLHRRPREDLGAALADLVDGAPATGSPFAAPAPLLVALLRLPGRLDVRALAEQHGTAPDVVVRLGDLLARTRRSLRALVAGPDGDTGARLWLEDATGWWAVEAAGPGTVRLAPAAPSATSLAGDLAEVLG